MISVHSKNPVNRDFHDVNVNDIAQYPEHGQASVKTMRAQTRLALKWIMAEKT